MDSSPEVVVIGSGIGGGTLANRLVQHGLNVTILERGGYLPQEPENWDVAAVFFRQKYLPQETWLDKEGVAFRPGTYYYVGGSSKMYGGTMLRLRERDFEDLEHAGGIAHLVSLAGDLEQRCPTIQLDGRPGVVLEEVDGLAYVAVRLGPRLGALPNLQRRQLQAPLSQPGLRWLSLQGVCEDRRRNCSGQARLGHGQAYPEDECESNPFGSYQRWPAR